MDKAKQAIRDFTSTSGEHDTTVHTATAAPVQHETVKPHHEEQIHTAKVQEYHQDHYHNTVQPIQDREVLPEQHHHNLGKVEKREFDHRNDAEIKAAIQKEADQFKDERIVQDAVQEKVHAPTVVGERVHHHIHETIQPVIHKETVEPHVMHTIVPIHETHHNQAQIHNTTTLPPVTMAEFKKTRGEMLDRREQRFADFKGQPEDLGGLPAVAHRSLHSDKGPTDGTFHGDFDEAGHRGSSSSGGSSVVGSGGVDGVGLSPPGGRNRASLVDGASSSNNNNNSSSSNQAASRSTGALPGAAAPAAAAAAAAMGTARASESHRSQPNVAAAPGMATGPAVPPTAAAPEAPRPRADSAKGLDEFEAKREGKRLSSSGSSRSSGSHDLAKKPSLLKKLNPLVDADGDGKKGFMS